MLSSLLSHGSPLLTAHTATRIPAPGFQHTHTQSSLSLSFSHSGPPNLIHHPPIQLHHVPINIPTPGQEKNRHRHLLIPSRPPRGYRMPLIPDLLIRHMTLLILITLLHRHLTGKIARGNAVDPHPRGGEFLGHHGREVDGRRLGAVVGKVALGVAHHARHAGDDDGGAVVLRGRRLQQRETRHRREVDRGHVGVVGRAPGFVGFRAPELVLEGARVGGVGDSLGAGDAGGGDDEGEVFFLRGDFFDEGVEGVFGTDVGGDGDDFTGGEGGVRGVGFGGVVEGFGAAAGDEDSGSFLQGSVADWSLRM